MWKPQAGGAAPIDFSVWIQSDIVQAIVMQSYPSSALWVRPLVQKDHLLQKFVTFGRYYHPGRLRGVVFRS